MRGNEGPNVTRTCFAHRNVHHALHQEQEKGWTASEPTTPVPVQQQQQQGGSSSSSSTRKHPYPAGDDGGTRNDAAFHAYLWAMMQRRPKECRRDWYVHTGMYFRSRIMTPCRRVGCSFAPLSVSRPTGLSLKGVVALRALWSETTSLFSVCCDRDLGH